MVSDHCQDKIIKPIFLEDLEEKRRNYLRAPRTVPFSFDWRRFAALRLGLVMRKVPLP